MYEVSFVNLEFRMRVLVLLACLAAAVCAEKARFDNYEVHRVIPANKVQLKILQELQEYPDGLSFWTEANFVGRNVDIMVPPHKRSAFHEIMGRFNIHNEVFIANVQENIDNEQPRFAPKAMDWTSYHRVGEINTWMSDLAAARPEVTSILGGMSFEGREIRGVKVSYGTNKPTVFIEAGIHAREWIAPAAVTWMLNEILTSTDPAIRTLAEAYDWYVFPSANPDGYEYTHTTDRMWRKTRSTQAGVTCKGADPNRNWGFHWGEGGSSNQPCSDTYMGPSAFSEPETKSLSEYITRIAGEIDVYLAFHSYSQFILIPYGLSNVAIPDMPQHVSIGNRAADALKAVHGTTYVVGNIVDLLYVASGGSMDWVKGTYGTDVAFTFELRDTGNFGFILPPGQIIPTGEETLAAVSSILNDVLSGAAKKH